MGVAYLESNEVDKSIVLFKKAKVIDPKNSVSYLNLSNHFLKTYLANFSVVNNSNFISKFITLQALLILARVDGKSPVEYFKKQHKALARSLAKNLLFNKSKNLNNFYKEWEKVVKT